MSDERSAPYPFLRNDAQMKFNSQVIDLADQPGFEFVANDEWVHLTPIQNESPFIEGIVLTDETGSLFIASEPFFVSGKRVFKISGQFGTVFLVKSKRRELLSYDSQGKSQDSNSPNQFTFYAQTFTAPALAAVTNWAYLDANLTWQIAPIGQTPNGMPFGWQALNGRSGRYYNIDFAIQDNGNGNHSLNYVVASNPLGLTTNGIGFTISPTQTSFAGACGVGEEMNALQLSSFPGGIGSFANVKSARFWTLAFVVGVAGATGPGGFVSVIRRGY